MQMVIEISEKTINEIKDNVMFAGDIPSDIRWDVTSAIVNGTRLPKGHGKLIDADEVLVKLWNKKYDDPNDAIEVAKIINEALTIIEGDKRGE